MLHDHYLIEQMANFNRERIAERQPHVVGHLRADVTKPVLERAFEYWRNIDQAIGDRIAKAF